MSVHPLLHPAVAAKIYERRHVELVREAEGNRAAREIARPNRIDRFFIKRREGKVTWIETVLVHRSA